MGVEGIEGTDELDLLAGATWSCTSTPAGALVGPDDLHDERLVWTAAAVPGTAGQALRSEGSATPPPERMDGQDWWFRCRFVGPTDGAASDHWVLSLDGLATLADVWLNGRHLLRSESMFAQWSIPIDAVEDDNELCLRFAALTPVLEQRRPRPRWKTNGVSNQNIRWIRTTLLGRQHGWASTPIPIGPWRPIRLRRDRPINCSNRRVRTTCAFEADGSTTGTVSVEIEVSGVGLFDHDASVSAELEVAGHRVPMVVTGEEPRRRLSGSVDVKGVERWWPHTHGAQPLYPVLVDIAGERIALGEVGFRTIEVDRSTDGFQLAVNGVPVFCRGAGWYPPDPVSLQTSDEMLSASIDLVCSAGLNMLRIPGGTVYEDERFFAACDRAGVLVWQEVMLGPVDPPDDETFMTEVVSEVSALLATTASHPSLAVLCGGQEIEEHAAMFGLPRERWQTPLIHSVLPDLVAEEAPGLVYVSSSPSGGDLPFQIDAGVTHYFGVGIYLLAFDDMRRSSPRFISEGLAFAIPPDRVTVDEEFDGGINGHLLTDWKQGVHRDAGAMIDLEDVRDHYTEGMFGAEAKGLWQIDADRALDFGRAAMVEVFAAAVAEWRRADSTCDGMLAIAMRDLRPGPGWGLVDSSGRVKAPWFALARGCAPVAVLCTDEGLNGLALHMVNDTAEMIAGRLEIGLHTAAHTVEVVSCPVVVPARGGSTVRADAHLEGFRDLTYTYRFGARSYELITADLFDGSGTLLSTVGHLPGGPARTDDPDLGLKGELEAADGGSWLLHVSCQRFAQYVQVEFPGYLAGDSWFHLPPGGSKTVVLRPEPGVDSEPNGRLRALNSTAEQPVSL